MRWLARWVVERDGRPVPPAHAVGPDGLAACDPRLQPTGPDFALAWDNGARIACPDCRKIVKEGSR